MGDEEQQQDDLDHTRPDRDAGSPGVYRLLPKYSLNQGLSAEVQASIARMYPGWRVQESDAN